MIVQHITVRKAKVCWLILQDKWWTFGLMLCLFVCLFLSPLLDSDHFKGGKINSPSPWAYLIV